MPAQATTGDSRAVARAVERLLAERGMSVPALSRESGVTQSTIWALAQATGTKRSTLVALSAALGCRPGYLADVYAREADPGSRADQGGPPGDREWRQLADDISGIRSQLAAHNAILAEWARELR